MTAATASTPKLGRRLYVEAGHSDKDSGAIAYDGTKEADLTQELQQLIVDRLDGMRIQNTVPHGLPAPFDRTFKSFGSTMQDEAQMTLAASIRHVNQTARSTDLLLSLHFNFNHPTATGLEAFVAEGTAPANVDRAARLLDVCHAALGLRIREGKFGKVKRDTEAHVGRLGILRDTRPQAILLEVCFLNQHDLAAYREKKTQLVKALCEFYFLELSGSAWPSGASF